MKSRTRFSILLPVCNLGFCFLLICGFALQIFSVLNLRAPSHRPGAKNWVISRAVLYLHSGEEAATQLGVTVATENFPGMVFDLAISRMSSAWPETWHPQGMEEDVWRCLSYPFFALPGWWFAGRGLEALFGRRRIHWIAVSFATVLFAFFLFFFVYQLFDFHNELHELKDSIVIALGTALWTALFAVFPIAWLRHRRQWKAELKAERAAKQS